MSFLSERTGLAVVLQYLLPIPVKRWVRSSPVGGLCNGKRRWIEHTWNHIAQAGIQYIKFQVTENRYHKVSENHTIDAPIITPRKTDDDGE
ncbi:uncharacterized protein H6S33_007936 [Morchella sextelata]|uniref:uncharacterized protein n=1 Tax=Morchella sextelata TaxID=1174677 RepID=UPI001D03DDCF|nr:uncharacterized protein H6S33_007936 [Morchella sextelata]KAH0602932.1 hypothetical protein H6S33_007936 [Morchella sextelata]